MPSINPDFRNLAQAMPHIVYVANAEGRISFINQQWTQITGQTVALALKHGLTDLVHPEDRQKILGAQCKKFAAGMVFSQEYRLFCKPGIYRWQLARAVPNHDDQGQLVSWYGTLTDIHELKQTQSGLQLQTELTISLRAKAEKNNALELQHLLICSEAAVAILQQKTIFNLLQEVANQARKIIGAQLCQISLTLDLDGVHQLGATARLLPSSRINTLRRTIPEIHHEMELSVIRLGQPLRVDRLAPSNSWRKNSPCEATRDGWLGVPILDKNGSNIGLLQLSDKLDGEFTKRDEYTAIELAQLAASAVSNFKLLAQMHELNLMNAELETFSYSVSHDLRSPLSIIDGFIRLLAKEIKGEQSLRVQHCLSRIHSGVTQMGGLIEGMLALAMVARTQLRCETLDLSQISHEIMERLRSQSPQRQAQISVQDKLLVQGDSRLMQSVMQNLLENAWKFSAKKDCCFIQVGYSTEKAAYFVSDNGVGFDMAMTGQLFVSFQRLHTAQGYAGTGVGLATTARVIARHGGKIWAESKPDCGATFFFTVCNSANPSA